MHEILFQNCKIKMQQKYTVLQYHNQSDLQG